MSEDRRFELVADALVEAQLLALDRRNRSLILDALEDELESLLLAHDPRFQTLLDEARARVRVTGGVPLADLRRRTAAAAD